MNNSNNSTFNWSGPYEGVQANNDVIYEINGVSDPDLNVQKLTELNEEKFKDSKNLRKRIRQAKKTKKLKRWLMKSLKNKYSDEKEMIYPSSFPIHLKRELIEKRYHPNAILANINRNKLNVQKVWENDNLLDKYYGKRGEVWTEGEGTAKGGETKRRLQKKRKTSKARKH